MQKRKNLIKTPSKWFNKKQTEIPQHWQCATWMKQSVLQRQQQPALHIRTVASYFDAKKCLTITWRSTCRQSKRSAWRLPLTPKAALTRRSFFQTPIKTVRWNYVASYFDAKKCLKPLGYLGCPAALRAARQLVDASLFFKDKYAKSAYSL